MLVYALLALFPAITAIVSCYALFAKPSTINDHLSTLSGVLLVVCAVCTTVLGDPECAVTTSNLALPEVPPARTPHSALPPRMSVVLTVAHDDQTPPLRV